MKKLSFCLNKNLDKQMAREFFGVQVGGIDFGQGILKTHPKLTKENTNEYFDDYYSKYREEITKKTEAVKQAWQKREESYFDTTEKIFGDYKFPIGKYIAYPSTINCNPRFLDTKTFQFFYQRTAEGIIYIIAHELTHFIFFDFVENNLKQEFAKLSENAQWDLSEIFNIVILRSELYQGIIQRELIQPYPDHEKYIAKFEKLFKESATIKEFIKRGIDILIT